jgi:hypothetical protein
MFSSNFSTVVIDHPIPLLILIVAACQGRGNVGPDLYACPALTHT